MSKKLSIDDMLEAARDSKMPMCAEYCDMAEILVNLFGEALARHLNIEAGCADDQGKAFGGLLVPFWSKKAGDPCPDVIHAGDPSGDWE